MNWGLGAASLEETSLLPVLQLYIFFWPETCGDKILFFLINFEFTVQYFFLDWN